MNQAEQVSFGGTRERENEPSKLILLVRHPSQEWFDSLANKAAQRGEDIESDLPINREGIQMVGMLVDHLKSELPGLIENGDYKIYTSPTKRARQEASIIMSNLRLAHTEHTELPLPSNLVPEVSEDFSEVPFTADVVYAQALIKRAREKKQHPIELWLEEEGKKLLPRFQERVQGIQRGLKSLDQDNMGLDIVVSHRLAIALGVWLVRHPDRDPSLGYQLKLTDLREIFDDSGNLPFTSITTLAKKGVGYVVTDIGQTPHLQRPGKENLRKGTY
jgi:broad specificity phosphatase PhoE